VLFRSLRTAAEANRADDSHLPVQYPAVPPPAGRVGAGRGARDKRAASVPPQHRMCVFSLQRVYGTGTPAIQHATKSKLHLASLFTAPLSPYVLAPERDYPSMCTSFSTPILSTLSREEKQ